MVKIIKEGNKELYLCLQCSMKYASKSKAEACEVWCKKNKSCNVEIIKHAENIK